MKERMDYLQIKVALKILKWFARPYRWLVLHSSVERRLKSMDIIISGCDTLEKIQDEFPEARMIRIKYLLIGLAASIDAINQLNDKYPQLAKDN